MKKLIFSFIILLFTLMISSCNNTYTISYYVDNELIEVDEYDVGGQIDLLTYEKEGYKFVAWNDADGNKFTMNEMPKGNITLYGQFEKIEEEGKVEKIVIILEDGRRINLELYPDIAPITVENFLKLVDQKYYDGVIFHRIIPNFMIQTGGYYIEDNSLKERPRVEAIKGEFSANGVVNNLKHVAGVISMARTNVMDSATSQFFICSATSPHLDGNYAAFGKVSDEESLKVVLDISFVPTFPLNAMFANFPTRPLIINTIERA